MTAIISVCYYLILLIWSLAYFVFMLVLFALTVAFDRERYNWLWSARAAIWLLRSLRWKIS